MSGKTTMARWLFDALGLGDRLSSVENNIGRTMFFDFGMIPIPIGRDWTVNAHFWTATGQDYYVSTRQTVMDSVDGVIFVADSQPNLMDSNLESWNELQETLQGTENVPVVVCLNKQDLDQAATEDVLRTHLSIPPEIAVFRVVASSGFNVAEAAHKVVQDVMRLALR